MFMGPRACATCKSDLHYSTIDDVFICEGCGAVYLRKSAKRIEPGIEDPGTPIEPIITSADTWDYEREDGVISKKKDKAPTDTPDEDDESSLPEDAQ